MRILRFIEAKPVAEHVEPGGRAALALIESLILELRESGTISEEGVANVYASAISAFETAGVEGTNGVNLVAAKLLRRIATGGDGVSLP